MIKHLLNVLRKTANNAGYISWYANDDVPTMFNIEINDNDSEIILQGDIIKGVCTAEFNMLHNYKLKINKNNLIKFNKNMDNVLTLFYKEGCEEFVLSC
ncbi:hypothetical protein FCV38_02435 [Clostridium sporogenes]|nr:hypothetical protein [Clostridium sporogenes]